MFEQVTGQNMTYFDPKSAKNTYSEPAKAQKMWPGWRLLAHRIATGHSKMGALARSQTLEEPKEEASPKRSRMAMC